MKIIRLVAMLVGIAVVFVAFGSGTAAASSECRPATRIGSDNPPQGELLVNAATTCREARFVIEHGRLTGSGNLVPGESGWTCSVQHRYHSGDVTLGAKIKCRRGDQAFSFGWAT